VRVRTTTGDEVVGDAVQLPAEPGTYTFAAPRVHGRIVGIDQTTGGHAIVQTRDCRPELGEGDDPCRLWSVDVYRSDPPNGTPDERMAGASLNVEGVFARDVDSDLLADETEDRTDLRLSAAAPETDRSGELSLRVTLTNAGPLAADLPTLMASSPTLTASTPKDAVIRWSGCSPEALTIWVLPLRGGRPCFAGALPAGHSRTFMLLVPAGKAVPVTLAVGSEGPDLHAEDNAISPVIQPLPAVTLTAARHQRLARGIATRLRLARPGSVRVVATFGDVRFARTVRLPAGEERTVTLRPRGADLRRLRAAHRATGRVVARRVGGRAYGAATVTVTG
jgi:hypothetical protein